MAARAAEELAVDPELARLLLRECVRGVHRPEGRPRRPRVCPAEVVPLPAAAVVEDRLAAVRVADAGEAGGDLADRGLPVDLLEAAVRAAAERRGEPVAPVLVA